jgi:AcrR family transcriptional regulator
MVSSAERTWSGSTLDARREVRRERLLEVGFELLGGQGSAAVTVRSVCRHARLTDRYFYESFADREELLAAVYDRVAEHARAVLADAVTRAGRGPEVVARAAVEAFVGLLTADPRRGRVLLLAPMTDPGLSTRALGLMPMFGELIRAQLAAQSRRAGSARAEPADGGGEPAELRLTASALIGALSNLFVRWLDGSLGVDEAELTEYCVRLLVHAVPLARPATPR